MRAAGARRRLLRLLLLLGVSSSSAFFFFPRPAAAAAAAAAGDREILTIESVAQYDELIKQSPRAALVEFYSDYCGSCQEFHPQWERLAADVQPGLVLARVNIDGKGIEVANAENALAGGIPHLRLITHRGDGFETLMSGGQGVRKAHELKAEINKHLGKMAVRADEPHAWFIKHDVPHHEL